MHAIRYCWTTMWALAAFCCFTAADEVSPAQKERSTREASVDTNDMLRRFVDELIQITPGSRQFPSSLDVGGRKLAPDGSFRIAAYETTQELYQLVTGGNPSRWRGPRNSVESMTYAEAEGFCARLTGLLRESHLIRNTEAVRLPTDIEWEYACRAGSVETFCFGAATSAAELLDQYAWHTGNAAGNDPAVGELKANHYGLYDVHGYLWEYVSVRSTDRPAAEGGTAGNRAMGGSWKDAAPRLTCDSRISVPLESVGDAIGFRCVVSDVAPVTKKASGE